MNTTKFGKVSITGCPSCFNAVSVLQDEERTLVLIQSAGHVFNMKLIATGADNPIEEIINYQSIVPDPVPDNPHNNKSNPITPVEIWGKVVEYVAQWLWYYKDVRGTVLEYFFGIDYCNKYAQEIQSGFAKAHAQREESKKKWKEVFGYDFPE